MSSLVIPQKRMARKIAGDMGRLEKRFRLHLVSYGQVIKFQPVCHFRDSQRRGTG